MGRMEAAKEARLAEQLARRGTPEFAAAGEQLVAEREAAAKAKARRDAAEREQRAERNMERAIESVVMTAAHDRHREAFEAMLADVAADQGCDVVQLDDGRSIEVMDAYAATLRPSKRNAAHVLALYRFEFGLSTTEAWARLRRIGGGR